MQHLMYALFAMLGSNERSEDYIYFAPNNSGVYGVEKEDGVYNVKCPVGGSLGTITKVGLGDYIFNDRHYASLRRALVGASRRCRQHGPANEERRLPCDKCKRGE